MKMKKMMKRLRCQKGVAAIEFAILLPLLLVIIFGIVEFSILLYDKQVITNASREGAREGIRREIDVPVRSTEGEIKSVVTNYVVSNLITFGTPNTPVTTVTPADLSGMARGDDLTVTVSYNYEFLVLPNFVTSLAGVKTIQAQTVMKAL
jgi:Flp pilus assembly protein TadG